MSGKLASILSSGLSMLRVPSHVNLRSVPFTLASTYTARLASSDTWFIQSEAAISQLYTSSDCKNIYTRVNIIKLF